MTSFDRRTFLELSSAALAAACSNQLRGQLRGQSTLPAIAADAEGVRVQGTHYSWIYTQHDDTFRIHDARGRKIVTGLLQPVIVVSTFAEPAHHQHSAGRALPPKVEGNRIAFSYEGVNGASHIDFTLRFENEGFWMEPVAYRSAAAEDIVSLRYFARVTEGAPSPALDAFFFVIPGISEGSSISPIVGNSVHLNNTVWLGHGNSNDPAVLVQQWALPLHYFCGFSISSSPKGMRGTFSGSSSEGRSDAFACGLADLPNGDLKMDLYDGKSSPWIDYRSDVWKHLRGPAPLTLGSTFYWAFGENYRDAIAAYYAGLVGAGIVRPKMNSPEKNASVLAPQFCTWGSQVCRAKTAMKLDEPFLNELYRELKDSGMKARMFSIDETWEEQFGVMQHSAQRFPHFEEFLGQIHADGNRVGLWYAWLRCTDPARVGLSVDNMLKRPDGHPVLVPGNYTTHFLYDFSQPQVVEAMTRRAREFVRRYKPDLIKFDFGYELPGLGSVAPADMQWAGEKFLPRSLSVMAAAMRQENPDIALMYYQLSPLLSDSIDLHALDDVFLAYSEYDVESNRRIFFSSLLGALGIPTYGSTGYEWKSAPNIWFDSAATGTLGSINDFRGDQMGESGTPAMIARFNGLTHAIRSANVFTVIPFPTTARPMAPTRGAHSDSWARLENGKTVLIALRPVPLFADDDSGGAPPSREMNALETLIAANAPVVVASKTSDGIESSRSLAVVPYGNGAVSIRRQGGKRVRAVTHLFGGGSSESQVEINKGVLHLPITTQNAAGVPVEWIEVSIS